MDYFTLVRLLRVVAGYAASFFLEIWPIRVRGVSLGLFWIFWMEVGWLLVGETYFDLAKLLVLCLSQLLCMGNAIFIFLIIFAMLGMVMMNHYCWFYVFFEVFVDYLENLGFVVILNSSVVTDHWNSLPLICCIFNWVWIYINLIKVSGSWVLRRDVRGSPMRTTN